MIIQTRSKIIVALLGSVALAGCVELTEAMEDAGAASAPARTSNGAATRSEVVPLHQRASQNIFHENDSPSDDGGSDAGGGSDTGGSGSGGGSDAGGSGSGGGSGTGGSGSGGGSDTGGGFDGGGFDDAPDDDDDGGDTSWTG